MDKNYCKENFAGGLSVSMKEMSETERPYEKSFKYGVEVLTDAELLAVILTEPEAGRQMRCPQPTGYWMPIRSTRG